MDFYATPMTPPTLLKKSNYF